MRREEAREALKGYLADYMARALEPSKSGLYCCPFCGSGTGEHGTGAFSILPDNKAFFCHACERRGDIFDLIGEIENIHDYNGKLERAAELYGITIDKPAPMPPKAAEVFTARQDKAPAQTPAPQPAEYTTFFLSAHNNIGKTDYPARRGLSKAVLDRFYIGFVAEWKHPKAPAKAPATPRLIIPTSAESYLARDTRDNIPEEQKDYAKQKVGSIHFLNAFVLGKEQKPVYIVEGEIDALSIMEAGGEAIALGTTTKKKAFVKFAAEHTPAQPLIIAMDNDEPGQKAAEELLAMLGEANIPAYKFNPCGSYKDANEALVNDRGAFVAAVRAGELLKEKAEEEARKAYLQNATSNYIGAFMDGIRESANTPAIPTGFMGLDIELDGGLYEGLYLVGAVSSIGKTTFCLQMADQIARQGRDVLFFSLEMSRFELMAKSISRNTYLINLETGGSAAYPKTNRGITAGAKYAYYSQEEKNLIKAAVVEYSQYAGHIFITEGMGDVGAINVRNTIAQHIRATKKAPVVFIDYLQILAPADVRATDKQNADKAILELKRISRDYKIPLIAISSINRISYGKIEMDMSVYKESGSLEYSSDVLFGLQFWKDPARDYVNPDEEKKKNPRRIELKILKNRNGKTGSKIYFNYDARFNVYEEVKEGFTSTGTGNGSEENYNEAAEFIKNRRKQRNQ